MANEQQNVGDDAVDPNKLEAFVSEILAGADSGVLKELEVALDPVSIDWLSAVEFKAGWKVAEIGTGAGSMLKWLSEAVGAKGKVLGIDINTSYSEGHGLANVDLQRVDLEHSRIGDEDLDLVFARATLMHMVTPRVALRNLWWSLKPGGLVAIHDLDCMGVTPMPGVDKSIELVERWHAGFNPYDFPAAPDLQFGPKLSDLLADSGFDVLRYEVRQPVTAGGDPITAYWRHTIPATQLAIAESLAGTSYAGLGEVLKENSEALKKLLKDAKVKYFDVPQHLVLAQKPGGK